MKLTISNTSPCTVYVEGTYEGKPVVLDLSPGQVDVDPTNLALRSEQPADGVGYLYDMKHQGFSTAKKPLYTDDWSSNPLHQPILLPQRRQP